MAGAALALPLCLTLCFAHAALAAAEPRIPDADHELTPFLGLRVGGQFEEFTDPAVDSLDIDESAAFGLIYGFAVDEGMMEILLGRQDTTVRGEGDLFTGGADSFDMTVDHFMFGGTYAWVTSRRVRPFVGAWLGAARFQTAELDQDLIRFAFSLGAGAKLLLGPRFAVRLQGRFTGSPIESDTSIFCSSSGVCFVSSEGTFLGQLELAAGLTLRF